MKFTEFFAFLILITVPLIKATKEVIEVTNANANSTIAEESEEDEEESEENIGSFVMSNPYKNDKDVRHSLYRAKNSWNRISGSLNAVPRKLEEEVIYKKFPTPDDYVAYKIAKSYKKMFDFLDDDAEEMLKPAQIENAFNAYKWPKPDNVSTTDWVKCKFEKFDINRDKAFDFIEFSHFFESVWDDDVVLKAKTCAFAVKEAMRVMKGVFEILDIDKKGKLEPSALRLGLSAFMGMDLDEDDLKTAFVKYDKQQDGTLNFQEFVLGMVNGFLIRSIKDDRVTDSFFMKKYQKAKVPKKPEE